MYRSTSTLLFVALTLVAACASRPSTAEDTTTSTTGSTSSGGTESGTSETGIDTQQPDPDLPPVDPCNCADGDLCVADCVWTADFDEAIDNLRCVGPPDCSGDPEDPMCIIAVCGYSVATKDCKGSDGVDLICNPYFTESVLCDELMQDCAEDEKCVLWVFGWEQAHDARCVVALGAAAIGESCSSEGALSGNDDCDSSGMCWNGALSLDPFDGTCHSFCTLVDGVPTCPDASSCQSFGEGSFQLCVPDP